MGPTPPNQSGAVEEKASLSQAPVSRDDAEEILHGPMKAVTVGRSEGQLSFPGRSIVPPRELIGEREQAIPFPPLLETIELRGFGSRLTDLEEVWNFRVHHLDPRLLPREGGIAREKTVSGADLRLVFAGQPLQTE